MKNKIKLISAVICCLLLIVAALGIGASAAGDKTVSIYKKTLSYEGAVRILYAVDAENLAEGEQIKLLFSYDEDVTAPVGTLDESAYAYVKGTEAIQSLGGKDYPVAFSEGFAPVDMTKPVYALPVIVNGEGEVVASGEAVGFSIFDYCTARFSASPTEDQLELYTSLLHYGASVQEVLLASGAYSQSELDEYGWADAFYVTEVTTKVDGEVAATEKICYREADVTIEAPKTYGNKIFAGFEDGEGNSIGMYGENTASSWNYYDITLPIGVTAFTYNYGGKAAPNVWTDESGNALTLYKGGYFTPDNGYNSIVDGVTTSSGTLINLYAQNEADGGAFVMDAPAGATWRPFTLINKNGTAGTAGSTYVFETDMRIEFDPQAVTSDRCLGYWGFSTGDYGANDNNFVCFPITRTTTSSATYEIRLLDNSHSGEKTLATLNFNEDYNVRIEYVVNTVGKTGASGAEGDPIASGTLKLYIDGKLAITMDVLGKNSGKSNATYYGFGIEERSSKFGAHVVYFDNTYLATE